MMLVPKRKNWDLFDDFFADFDIPESKLMKTDIKEHENSYELLIDLPGFEKNEIKVSVEDGYLNIQAKTSSHQDENKKGKYIRHERYEGEYKRSFYIGDDITEDKIKASFKNGVLDVFVPKVENKAIPTKKYIEIE